MAYNDLTQATGCGKHGVPMSMFSTVGAATPPTGRKENPLRKLERMNQALRHEEPERVPISDFFWGGFSRRWRDELDLTPDADPCYLDTVKSLRPDFPVSGSVIEVSECLTRLIGPENALLWMGEYPDEMGEVIHRIGAFYLALARAESAAGGGLIFQSDHSVSSSVSGKTYDSIVMLVCEHGRYPLELGEFDETR